VAVVDRTGKLLDTATHLPARAAPRLGRFARRAGRAGAEARRRTDRIGNGTASRETDKLAAELMSRSPRAQAAKVTVSEAGASVYSASELAAKEFPDLDVSLRGAVSIARRLQDPLAELVKIEPKAIGVGQYQHDRQPVAAWPGLDAVVEDCVNAVGVDVNTASAALLKRVVRPQRHARRQHRRPPRQARPLPQPEALKQVPRLGPKTFEQAAGFLRVPGGDNPLDASSVHPEAYPVVERILADQAGHEGLDGS
jgi:uncharacterized protein